MNSKVPMTKRGADALREQLRHLKSVERPAIIEAIAAARELGDLKENAEYHAARERQSFCEGRIRDIEGKLSNAQIIDVTGMVNNGKVVFGATVTLSDEDTGDQVTYQIVGEDEADIKCNRISVSSPLARALVAKTVGDIAEFQAPAGLRTYEILEVLYL